MTEELLKQIEQQWEQVGEWLAEDGVIHDDEWGRTKAIHGQITALIDEVRKLREAMRDAIEDLAIVRPTDELSQKRRNIAMNTLMRALNEEKGSTP